MAPPAPPTEPPAAAPEPEAPAAAAPPPPAALPPMEIESPAAAAGAGGRRLTDETNADFGERKASFIHGSKYEGLLEPSKPGGGIQKDFLVCLGLIGILGVIFIALLFAMYFVGARTVYSVTSSNFKFDLPEASAPAPTPN